MTIQMHGADDHATIFKTFLSQLFNPPRSVASAGLSEINQNCLEFKPVTDEQVLHDK